MSVTIQKSASGLTDTCIYNRFDLLYDSGCSVFDAECDGTVYRIPYHVSGSEAQLGLWLNPVPEECVDAVCDRLKTEYGVRIARFEQSPVLYQKQCQAEIGNHWHVDLPQTADELDGRLSKKKRYNMRREKRIAEEEIGAYEIAQYPAENAPQQVIDAYFAFKSSSHGADYGMSAQEYLRRYHVTNVYALRFSEEIGAVLFGCEQSDTVYLENLSYNPSYKKYSLGSILYDEYLKILIEKGKKRLLLGGGHQEYKSYYGAVEQTTYSGAIYLHRGDYLRQYAIPHALKKSIYAVRVCGSAVKRKINLKARLQRGKLRFRAMLERSRYKKQLALEVARLGQFAKKDSVLICAHPDDESLFFFDALKRDPSILVVCLSGGSNAARNAEFHSAMQALGADALIFDLPDSGAISYRWKRGKVLRIASRIKKAIHPKTIYTHNASGEYGHPHHQMVNSAVSEVFRDCEIFVPEEPCETVCEWKAEKLAFFETHYPTQKVSEWFPQYLDFEGLQRQS